MSIATAGIQLVLYILCGAFPVSVIFVHAPKTYFILQTN
jgi:hypothetical protein